MSISAIDFEGLLRKAIDQATADAPQANQDLLSLAHETANAVSKVTQGAATLELSELNAKNDPRLVYRLQLRKEASKAPATDLGIYRLALTGYPIHRWWGKGSWQSHPDKPDSEHLNRQSLEDHFKWLIATPDSKLVVLVNYLRQQEVQD